VSGADRASYLQGLLTNDIVALTAGHGCYAAYLTAQGRMIADLHVYELGDVILLTLQRDVKDAVLAKLDQFIFSEDVQLGDVTDSFDQIAVVGPDAPRTLGLILDVEPDALRALPEHGNLRAGSTIITRTDDTGEPGFDVYTERIATDDFRTRLASAGAVTVDASTADALRIEGGVPLFHRDMDEETIPLEAGIESRAISFTKGCYVGQEVVIRVLHRGHGRVARKLIGLVMSGDRIPAAKSPIHAGDREVGQITSAAWSPAFQRPIALGYVHRDFTTPGTTVRVDGADAEVSVLPFERR
jgi:folate-binding protein YgfZ